MQHTTTGSHQAVPHGTTAVCHPAHAGVYRNMRHGIVALVFRYHIASGQPTSTAEASEVS